MPTYVVTARAELLDPDRRRELAERITTVHADATGAPRSFAQVIVSRIQDGADHFVGGEPAEPDTVFVHGHIRAGRDAATANALLTGVRDAVVAVTGVGREAVWVYLAELPPERMVEFGEVLPEPGGEAAWIDGLPAAAAARVGRPDGRGAASGGL